MDIERTMEFLLQQQARFAEQQARFAESQARLDERVALHDERQAKFESDLLQINALLLDVAASQERTNEIVAVLAQKLVDLTSLVERHIAGHS